MKKNNKKSPEERIKTNNILMIIMMVLVLIYAGLMISDMVMQRSINMTTSTMIASMGCLISCLGTNNKKLKDELKEEKESKEDK